MHICYIHVCLWISGAFALKSRRTGENLKSVSATTPAVTHRVAWMHVPKCGASFGTALLHYANRSLPDEARIREKVLPGASVSTPEEFILEEYPVNTYFRDLLWLKGDGNWGNHLGIDKATYKEFKGDFFGLFRHPASRAISSWYHFGQPRFEANGVKITDYARMVEGLTCKLITGQESFHKTQCCCHEDVQPNVNKAIKRLKAFRFVGLTEEFEMSVCLFHAMFGGDCLPVEFENMRPGSYNHSTIDQDIATLEGYVDPFDSVLYEKVRDIFRHNLKKYNVKRSTCASLICPAAAGYFSVYEMGDAFRAVENDAEAFEYDWPGRFHLDD